jgi:hypothetical protein
MPRESRGVTCHPNLIPGCDVPAAAPDRKLTGMDGKPRMFGPLAVAATAILAIDALIALAIVAPFLLPGNDVAVIAFRYTWATMRLIPRWLGWLLRIATVGSIIVLVKAAIRTRTGQAPNQDALPPAVRMRRAVIIAGFFVGGMWSGCLIVDGG